MLIPAFAKGWLARSLETVQKYHPEFLLSALWIGQASLRRYLAKFAAFHSGPLYIERA